jgi:HlyD family secretion protein
LIAAGVVFLEKRKKLMLAGAVLVLALIAYWCYLSFVAGHQADLTATGTIEATSVELNAKTPGTISSFQVKEGDVVDQGQIIAKIVRQDLVAQRESNLMALTKAQDQLADLTSGSRSQEIEAAAANVNIARATWEKSKEDLDTREALYQQGAISQDDLKSYQVKAETDYNKLQAAQAQLNLLEAGSRPDAIAAAQAEVERNRALLQASDAVLKDLNISSPLHGVVTSKNYEEGEYVQAGSSVATVADLNHLWIRVYIATDDLPFIHLGQKVTVTVSGSRGVFTGKVSEIANQGEFTPKSIQTKQERANVVFGVKIQVDNHKGTLKPGMPADVTFVGSRHD